MDKKPVNLMSTCADPTKATTVKRLEDGKYVDVPCPEVLPLYSETMRGVDVFAQRLSYSKIGRRSVKWFYSLAWFMFDTAIHNAAILYQQKHKKEHYSEKDFRKDLMKQLVGSFTARKVKHAPRKRPRDALHALEHSDVAGTCSMCRRRVGQGGHNARSRWRCADCQQFLCLPDCYNKHLSQLAAEHIEDEEH